MMYFLIFLTAVQCGINVSSALLCENAIVDTQKICKKIFEAAIYIEHTNTKKLDAIKELVVKIRAAQKTE